MSEITKEELAAKCSYAAALGDAQKAVTALTKGDRNDFSGYDYVSADHLIETCKVALIANGLVLSRVEANITDIMLRNVFVLLHIGGHSQVFEGCFPIVEKNGTPKDKAAAIALTSSLGYFLRDLLLVPRFGKEEMDKRDDSAHEPAAIYDGSPQGKRQLFEVFKSVGVTDKAVMATFAKTYKGKTFDVITEALMRVK